MSSIGKEHVEDGLLVQAMDEELTPRQALRVQRHVEQCVDCRERFERLRGVTSLVVEYHREMVGSDPALAEAERQQFATRLGQAPSGGHPVRRATLPRRGWAQWSAQPLWQRAAWCGGLSLLILAGLFVGTGRPRPAVAKRVQPSAGPARVVVVSPAPKQLAAVVTARAIPARGVIKKQRSPLSEAAANLPEKATNLPEKATPGAVEQRAASEEIATPFFSLPFSDASLPLSQAAVIRVELPRSALTLTGMPVPESRRNERVRADLVMGADGLARAIRFVR